jgi:hypothetical protein
LPVWKNQSFLAGEVRQQRARSLSVSEILTFAGYLLHLAGFVKQNKLREEYHTALPHLITHWEQHDGQYSSLVSRTYQTLDKACYATHGFWHSFRFNPKPF